jgi:hypothetical protein
MQSTFFVSIFIVMCGVSGSTIFFHIILKKRSDFGKMCFDFLCNFRLKQFSFLEEFSKILPLMYEGRRVNYPLFLPGLKKLEFSRYSNNSQISNFTKIRPVIAELPHSDGRKEPKAWQS